jgi:hypothetical protein
MNNATATPRRLAVIGAGPVGLVAALGGARRGMDVTVLEQGEVGASLRRWGPTRFFSPFSMNLPPWAAEFLGTRAPSPDALLTGPEFVDEALLPLARSAPLAGRVLSRSRVLSVGRSAMNRRDYAGHPLRGERPFRLLIEGPEGERILEADAVLDASGTLGNPAALGLGGGLVPGERSAGARLIRDLGTLHERLTKLAGRQVLLVGSGHSAANALGWLDTLAHRAPETRVVWASRALNLRPCTAVASDPLPERQRVVDLANQLAARPPGWLRVERRASIEALTRTPQGALSVALTGGRSAEVDAVIALTGYRPDLSFLSELALDIAPASEGSARLARALSSVTDCLSVPAVPPAALASGEDRFHLIGAKSYGRVSTFLLQTGHAQVETLLDALF